MLYETKYYGYCVDELGNVWSLKVKGGQGKLGKPRLHNVKIDKYGYQVVCLSNGNNRKYETVHRLVYESIKGEIPKDMQVDHIDKNKQNNNITNLQLLSLVDNVRKARCGVSPWQKGKKHSCRNLYELYVDDRFVGVFDKKQLINSYDITKHDLEYEKPTKNLIERNIILHRV